MFNKHKKKAIGIHTIKLELVRYLKEKGISVIPGQKLCRNCYETVKKEEAKVEDDMTNTENSQEEPQSSDFEGR